jgi:hypothetical protein
VLFKQDTELIIEVFKYFVRSELMVWYVAGGAETGRLNSKKARPEGWLQTGSKAP